MRAEKLPLTEKICMRVDKTSKNKIIQMSRERGMTQKNFILLAIDRYLAA